MSDHDELERDTIGDAPRADHPVLLGALLMGGAPVTFLTALTLRYLLTDAACAGIGGRVALELSALVGVAGAALATWYGWKGVASRSFEPITETAADGHRFAAAFGFMTGLLFLLASLALWLPSLFLSPCALR